MPFLAVMRISLLFLTKHIHLPISEIEIENTIQYAIQEYWCTCSAIFEPRSHTYVCLLKIENDLSLKPISTLVNMYRDNSDYSAHDLQNVHQNPQLQSSMYRVYCLVPVIGADCIRAGKCVSGLGRSDGDSRIFAPCSNDDRCSSRRSYPSPRERRSSRGLMDSTYNTTLGFSQELY